MKKELLVCIGFILCAFMSTTSYGETTTSKTDTICLGYSGKIFLPDTAAHILAECLARDRSAVGQNFKVEISSNRINSYSTIKGVKLPIPTNIVLGSNPETELVTLTLKYDRKITSVGNNAIPKISPEFGSKDIDKVMWDLFGRIVVEGVKSETFIQENSLVINTTHEITVSYVVLKSMQEDEMPIISGGICFDKEEKITLNVNSKFTSFAQQWIAETLIIDGSSTASSVKLQVPSSSAFLHTVIYTVEGCNSSKSDTIVIGKQSTKPTIADTSLCIPTGEPSLTTSIKDPSPFLIYHWTLKNNQGEKVDSKNGTTVDLAIPPYGRGEITVYASGGCDTSYPTMTTIHRSINPENIKLELEEDRLCLFAGDTVHFKLSQKVEEDLIWNKPALWVQIPPKTGEDTNFTRSYILRLAADSIYATDMLSVYGKYCSDDTSSTSVFFRKNTEVVLKGDVCLHADSTYTYVTLDRERKSALSYEWSTNFGEQSSTDSVFTIKAPAYNPNKKYFMVATTKECHKSAFDTLYLNIIPPAPTLDSLSFCVPTGKTSLVAKITNLQNELTYHWFFKPVNGVNSSIVATMDTLPIPAYTSGTLSVYASGGCDTSLLTTAIVHRSIDPDNVKLVLNKSNLCLFADDTVQFTLNQNVEDILVWNKPTLWEQLPIKIGEDSNFARSYILKMPDDSTIVSDTIYVSGCGNQKTALPVYFRKNTKVDLKEEMTCVHPDSTYTYVAIPREIPSTYEWKSSWASTNETVIDSICPFIIPHYQKDQDLFISVTTKECNRTASDTLLLNVIPLAPEIAQDVFCIPTGDTLLEASIKHPQSKLIYHWTFKDNRDTVYNSASDTSVYLSIPAYKSGILTVYASGGCDTSFPTMTTIHRSINPENIKLELEEDSLCLFAGDTVHFKLSQKVEEDLIWNKPALWVQIPPKTGEDTNFTRSYILQLAADSIYATDMLSVYGKYCSDDTSSTSVFFRKDLKVSLIGDICVRADSTTIFTADAGKNQHAKYQWTCNFAEIEEAETDSATKAFPVPMDAGKGLFVTVKTTECRRIATDTLFVFVKASTPEINETLWDEETACMPLGMTDSIHLQVQAQNGIDGFTWILPSDWEIRSKDSVGIKAEFLAPLSMQGDSVTVGVYANSEACGSSDTIIRKIGLYGANVDTNWGFGYIFYAEYPNTNDCPNCGTGLDDWFSVGFIDSAYSSIDPIDDIVNQEFVTNNAIAWKKESGDLDGGIYYTNEYSSLEKAISNFTATVTNTNLNCSSRYEVDVIKPTILANASKIDPDPHSEVEFSNQKQSIILGLQKESELYQATLIPNPAHDKTTLHFTQSDAPIGIEVLNAMGVCVYKTISSANKVEINTATYSSGIYFVRCINTQNGKSFTKKLLIR